MDNLAEEIVPQTEWSGHDIEPDEFDILFAAVIDTDSFGDLEREEEEVTETENTTDFAEECNTDAYSQYLKDVGSFPLLTREEEKALAMKKDKGDEKAKELLVNSNLRLVIRIARQYYSKEYGTPFLDYIQNGNIGLITAVDKFDYKKGFKLSTYATYWIKQTIIRETMKQAGVISFPTQVNENLTRINKAIREFANENFREPTLTELARITKLSIENIKEIWRFKNGVVSLDAAFHDDDDDAEGNLGAKLASGESEDEPFEKVVKILLAEQLGIIESKLSAKEYDIISKRYGLFGETQHTLQDIAKDYDLTRERIRQIEKRALKKLSEVEQITDLADYLN